MSILGLKLPTDPRWVNLAERDLEEILIDHAFCEQKAATSCISMIVQFPEFEKVVEVLTPVVSEEWGHFERVLREMKKRGYHLTRSRNDRYVVELMKHERKGGSRNQQLMEKCLINALIEARSAERFKMLWKGLKDEKLQKFYHDLMVSEANHYVNFIELAKEYNPEEVVNKRWKEYLEVEADIIANLEVRGDRMH